jgi:hypothetical protein
LAVLEFELEIHFKEELTLMLLTLFHKIVGEGYMEIHFMKPDILP